MAKTPISLRRLSAACLLLGLSACSSLGRSAVDDPAPVVWLLGEVHDNPAGHQQRFTQLQSRVLQGWRPAIAMEQFDREQQPALDQALRECGDASCVIQRVAGDSAAWHWSYYQPLIQLALTQHLPLLAANLSRGDAVKVMRQGYAAALDPATLQRFALDLPVTPDLLARQREEIIVSHCHKLPLSMVDGMVRAQIARDVWMAQVLSPYATSGVVLLAGNGHVRRDLGVPRWLAQIGIRHSQSVGFIEVADSAEFDRVHLLPPHPRPDSCDEL